MRLFTGLLLPPELAARVAEDVRGALGEDGGFRLVPAAGLHLTLVFLGETPAARLAPLAAALEEGFGGAPAPRLELGAAGSFPAGPPGRESVLWLGVREAPGAEGRLAVLHRRACEALVAAGADLAEELSRPYRPHLTVARRRPRAHGPVPAAFRALAPGLPWRPGEAALVESIRRGPGPPAYEPRAVFPLDPQP